MTTKVTIHAHAHACEVREIPVVNGEDLPWESLSDETRRWAAHTVPLGETREFNIHSGKSLIVRERP
jgi:hypothetical protein